MSHGFLIDTNVLLELMRDTPDSSVLAWFSEQTANLLHTSAVTQAEILAGISLLPAGKRRDAMANAASEMFEKDFSGRCHDFGKFAVPHGALVRTQRQRLGRPIDTADAQNAAIALANRFALLTRNTKDFEDIEDLKLINPWQSH